MAKYRVVAGIHWDINPNYKGTNRHHPDRLVKFETGSICETERDLCQEYPNKFQRLPLQDQAPVVTDERRDAVQDLISKGIWGEEDRKFLEDLNEDGFVRIVTHSGKSITETRVKVVSPLGEEVTDKFQLAYDSELKVFVNATGKHQVTDKKNTNKPLNKEPLDAKEVDKFVAVWFKEVRKNQV